MMLVCTSKRITMYGKDNWICIKSHETQRKRYIKNRGPFSYPSPIIQWINTYRYRNDYMYVQYSTKRTMHGATNQWNLLNETFIKSHTGTSIRPNGATQVISIVFSHPYYYSNVAFCRKPVMAIFHVPVLPSLTLLPQYFQRGLIR